MSIDKTFYGFQGMVADFHLKHDIPARIYFEHKIPAEEVVLRLRLMMEELGELASAMHAQDPVGIADGLADLLYVTIGTCVSYGLPSEHIFKVVHESNMTKESLNDNLKGGKVGKSNSFIPPDWSFLRGYMKK